MRSGHGFWIQPSDLVPFTSFLTLAEVILLSIGGMPLSDSVCHSFATIATGGFGTQNDSIAGYSNYIQYVIIAFMFLSGHLPILAKFLLTFDMIIGRLEIYAFLVLFSPAFWKR